MNADNSKGKVKKPQKSGKVFIFENIRRGATESDYMTVLLIYIPKLMYAV